MKRRLLSLFVAFAMTISMVVVGAGAVEPTYGDTAGHWAESAIERWSGHGIIQGSNGEFDPNGQLTCAQLATILAKLLKLPAAKDAGFNDNAAGAWYYDAINRCAAAGILNGNGDGTVDPNGAISRERAMVMLGRALGIQPIEKPDLTKFSDAAKVASYAQGMVAALIEKGIVGGVTSDTLAPQDDINRASTVTILDRAIGSYADKAGETVKVEGKGIVLVVADDVTITGDVEQIIVPADNIEVTIRGCKDIDSIIVTGENSKVILDNSSANDVTLDGKNTELETKSGSKVENVSVTEDAAGVTVNAGSGTSIGSVENKAEDTTVTGNGTVKEVASDTDITVETKNTNVENSGDEKITVTDAKGKDSTVSATGSGSSTTVNKETTSSGGGGYSHSHSYDATTHKCSCGQFDPAVVATIGSEKGYLTLEAAINAAQSGDTVKLMKNIAISPELTDEQKQESKLAAQLTVNTDIVLDMNGKKLSVTEGDFGRASPLLIAVTGGTVTVKGNGEINCEAGESQVYGINVNGGNLIIEDGTFYGAITAVQVQQGSLIIKGGTFDLAPTCKSMVPQYAKYIVNVIDSAWKSGTATVSISGGTFGFNPSANPEGTGTTYLADGYQATETAEGSGFWTITAASDAVFVAEVGGVQYTTLAAAIDAAQSGDTVTLLNNVELSAALEIPAKKTITLDLNGKKLSTTTKTDDTSRHYYAIDNYGVFTLLDSSAEQTGEIRARGIENLESGKMVIESGTIVAIDTNGGAAVWNKADLTINGGVFKAEYEGTSEDSYGPGCVYSEGTVLVTGGAFESANKRTYAFVSKTGSVTITPAGGKTVNISGAHGGLGIDGGTAIINGGNYSSSEYYGLYVSNDSRKANVTVNDGSFTGKNYSVWIGSDVKNTVDSTLTINGGTFNKPINEQENATGKLKVTGGTFSSDPSEYVAEGYKTEGSDGNYTVRKMNWDEYPADGTLMPAGVKIEDRKEGDGENGKTFTVTLEDKEAFLYFTQQFNREAAFEKRKENWTSEGFTKYPSEYNMADLNMWYGPYCSRITVKLGCDVDLGGMEIEPFGMSGCVFNFDGGGHTISNAKIIETNGDSKTNVGFFQSRANVSNVVFDGIQVTAAGCGSAGVVAGSPNSNITNVTVKNCSVTGAKYTGAIAGYDYGDITGCKVDNTVVSGQYKVGGIVGYVCTDNEEQQRNITGNTLTGVTVKGDNLWSGKSNYVIGKIVGNWNAAKGSCTNNSFTGTTVAANDIGETENGCTVTTAS